MVVRRRRMITQQSIPRSKRLQIRHSPLSLDQLSPGARPQEPSTNDANALAPFPTYKYFLTLTLPHEISSLLHTYPDFRTRHRGETQGDHEVPVAQSMQLSLIRTRTIFYYWQMVVSFYRFLEPCGLAHSRHPDAQHLKARVRLPHLLG